MDYTPHTEADLEQMLERVGAKHLRDLYRDLPQEIVDPPLQLDTAMTEAELMRHLRTLAAKNQSASVGFLGGGIRAHYIPAAVPALAARAEFLSAYTPYQPEASQGLLQAIFEYQTMISELTGLPVANASMYDGSTALAEGALLALRESGRMRVAILKSVHPEYRRVVKTYLEAIGAELVTLESTADPIPPETGAVVVQNPDFLGSVHNFTALAEAAHAAGALLVAVVDPLSLALLKPPGEYGADVAVGEGQPLGNAMAFGGPHFGFMAVRADLVRQLPGRLVSETTDADGKRGYILTLQAREQYIRRSKAKSNITTNAQLTALMGAVYLAALGPQGLKEVATRSVAMAHALAERLSRIPGVELVTPEPFFNEFAVRLPKGALEVRLALARKGIAAATPVPAEYGPNLALFACTEQHTEADLDNLAEALREVLR
ncbi:MULTISPECIES: aminomethyl-transferring glycine dehydrogenase subunit GcvPA [unclassified Meiothermus]|uniref:aminomethyl-transferring glycine dehydrogenase subunit GcvPA n=1 Tax=unclassified Meiothermus TaxID=370471 RepID=UPI000D7BAEF0|nr:MULTISPECIES: aminomethyl-transferring glycine dehydrogenase subunit GcvPA [unclassified Meiothermus]PZA07002.1 aminomethyl-transferring glycine dehydrogenase subunit GcvPA [Meiothermus sp. Pnk-1]RYM35296.1 aminomethyl-transferring glycine dehydrogenase subunit GcvPA [Meiothermus sp. PNK-Is4]